MNRSAPAAATSTIAMSSTSAMLPPPRCARPRSIGARALSSADGCCVMIGVESALFATSLSAPGQESTQGSPHATGSDEPSSAAQARGGLAVLMASRALLICPVRHQTAVYQENASAPGTGVSGPIFLNSLLVFSATRIATGVNTSGNPDRHAVPLGRREE